MKLDSVPVTTFLLQIPVTTATPWNYKIAAFRPFIGRAFLVYSEEILVSELNYIVNIGRRHDYKPHLIFKLIDKY